MQIILIALILSAIYCGAMWFIMAAIGLARKVDTERETFHLGLCFLIAIGFLGLLLK